VSCRFELSLDSLTIGSYLDLLSNENIDIFAVVNSLAKGVVLKLFIREGKVISSSFSTFKSSDFFDIDKIYKQDLLEFYKEGTLQVAKKILLAESFEEQKELSTLFSRRFNKKITISQPKRGAKVQLIALALKNANEILKNQSNRDDEIEIKIAELFELDTIPSKVESFDNSHMMGVASVGAMVVRSEGEWVKKDYRRYALKAKDEYGQMREMLTRRVQDFSKSSLPDLWILDGGETLNCISKFSCLFKTFLCGKGYHFETKCFC
jgi:excinuclease ABC subunit C